MAIKFRSKVAQGWGIHSKVEPFKFPGGEWHLRLPNNEIPDYAYVVNDNDIAKDIILLGLWADWCHSLNCKAVVKMPYLPAARADRGTPFSGKVYANLINSLDIDEIIVFDPHSDIVPSLINNVKVVNSARVIKNQIFGKSGYTTYTGIICPDEGAKGRATEVAEMANLPVYQAKKVRDFDTGKILDYQPGEVLNAPKDGRYLVVDDICDGGGTFKFLAETIEIPRSQLGLWVSHGIFSGNAEQLNNYYGEIYTTDSVTPINDIGATTIHIEHYLNNIYYSQKGENK